MDNFPHVTIDVSQVEWGKLTLVPDPRIPPMPDNLYEALQPWSITVSTQDPEAVATFMRLLTGYRRWPTPAQWEAIADTLTDLLVGWRAALGLPRHPPYQANIGRLRRLMEDR